MITITFHEQLEQRLQRIQKRKDALLITPIAPVNQEQWRDDLRTLLLEEELVEEELRKHKKRKLRLSFADIETISLKMEQLTE